MTDKPLTTKEILSLITIARNNANTTITNLHVVKTALANCGEFTIRARLTNAIGALTALRQATAFRQKEIGNSVTDNKLRRNADSGKFVSR